MVFHPAYFEHHPLPAQSQASRPPDPGLPLDGLSFFDLETTGLSGGTGTIAFLAAINALLQLSSRDDMRGRVMALWSIVFFGSTPIGAPIAGFLAANLGTRWALALGGLATLLTVAACLPLARRLHPVEAETPAT